MQSSFTGHESLDIHIHGIDNTVISNTAFYIIIVSPDIASPSTGYYKFKPLFVISVEYQVTTLFKKSLTVEQISIYHCWQLPIARFRQCKIIGLLINIRNIETLTEIKILSTMYANRFLYPVCTGMIYLQFIHLNYYSFPNAPTCQ